MLIDSGEAKKGKDSGQSADNLSVPKDDSPSPTLKRQGTLRRKFFKDRGNQQGIVKLLAIVC